MSGRGTGRTRDLVVVKKEPLHIKEYFLMDNQQTKNISTDKSNDDTPKLLPGREFCTNLDCMSHFGYTIVAETKHLLNNTTGDFSAL